MSLGRILLLLRNQPWLRLHPTQKRNRATASVEKIQDNLTRVLEGIEDDITQAGTIVDYYYTQASKWVSAFFSDPLNNFE
jgi:hypothetical protein